MQSKGSSPNFASSEFKQINQLPFPLKLSESHSFSDNLSKEVN